MPTTGASGGGSPRKRRTKGAETNSAQLVSLPADSPPAKPATTIPDWQKPMKGIGRVGKPLISESLLGAIGPGGGFNKPKIDVYERALKDIDKASEAKRGD